MSALILGAELLRFELYFISFRDVSRTGCLDKPQIEQNKLWGFSVTDEELTELIEAWFTTGVKIIHPAFPAYLKSSEKVEFEHRHDGWFWVTSIYEKGPFKTLREAREDRTTSAEERLEAERKGSP